MCVKLSEQDKGSSAKALLLKGEALSTGDNAGSSASTPPGLRRKKIWELEPRFHCSIAGTCFTLDELRRFYRKAHGTFNGVVSDYELHITFVGLIGNAQAARPINKYLDRKYQATIQYFDEARSPEELGERWHDAVSRREISGAFWALATHPLASEELRFRIYGEVHMLSHLSGASLRIDMQTLSQLRRRVPDLEQALEQARSARLQAVQKKDQAIEALNKCLGRALKSEQKLQAVEAKYQLLEGDAVLHSLRTTVEEYADKLKRESLRADRTEVFAAEQMKIAAACHSENLRLKSRFLALTEERDALESTLEHVLSTQHTPSEDNAICHQKIDLDGRSVLYVGGRNRLCPYFRSLIEQQNGHFIHHDGGREESTQRLDALLVKVDVVLCPVDCISHDAVHRIKRDCKRYGKHLMLLPQSSLSAFTKGIREFYACPR